MKKCIFIEFPEIDMNEQQQVDIIEQNKEGSNRSISELSNETSFHGDEDVDTPKVEVERPIERCSVHCYSSFNLYILNGEIFHQSLPHFTHYL